MGLKTNGTELVLSGMVGGDPDGDDFWFADGFAANHVIQALAEFNGADLTVRVNSGGGIATEGAAIYAALAQYEGKISVIVEGIAASAASLLIMAADTITMAPGSVMMIHDPLTLTVGDARAHQKTIDALNALGNAYAGIYAKRSGKTLDDARAVMREETWFTGEEAVEAGFADTAAFSDNDNEPSVAAFAYASYRKAPTALVAMANAKGWTPRATLAAPATPSRQKEPTMTIKTEAGADPVVENTSTDTIAPAVDAVAEALALAAEVTAICAAAGEPQMAAELITARMTADQARAKVGEANSIKAAVADARKVSPAISADLAAEFIKQGKSVAEARSDLLDLIVANQSPELSAQPPAAKDTAPKATGWDKTIEALNARQG
jgi:ATP-dependent Clp protease protease subunit